MKPMDFVMAINSLMEKPMHLMTDLTTPIMTEKATENAKEMPKDF